MSKDELTLFTKGEVFLRYVSLQKDLKALEKDLKAEWDKLKEGMVANSIPKVDGEWGSISIVPQKSYKAVGEAPKKFMKTVLDTEKVGAHVTLTGELPKGVEQSKIIKLVKRFK
jgi:hypothetical protein